MGLVEMQPVHYAQRHFRRPDDADLRGDRDRIGVGDFDCCLQVAERCLAGVDGKQRLGIEVRRQAGNHQNARDRDDGGDQQDHELAAAENPKQAVGRTLFIVVVAWNRTLNDLRLRAFRQGGELPAHRVGSVMKVITNRHSCFITPGDSASSVSCSITPGDVLSPRVIRHHRR